MNLGYFHWKLTGHLSWKCNLTSVLSSGSLNWSRSIRKFIPWDKRDSRALGPYLACGCPGLITGTALVPKKCGVHWELLGWSKGCITFLTLNHRSGIAGRSPQTSWALALIKEGKKKDSMKNIYYKWMTLQLFCGGGRAIPANAEDYFQLCVLGSLPMVHKGPCSARTDHMQSLHSVC